MGRFFKAQFQRNDQWRRVSRIGPQVLGTFSLPLTSAICARAVVVYCLWSAGQKQPAVALRQTLILADKGGLNLDT